jgi:hypothetical protein
LGVGRFAFLGAEIPFASAKELDELGFGIEYSSPDTKEFDASGFTGAKKGDASDA